MDIRNLELAQRNFKVALAQFQERLSAKDARKQDVMPAVESARKSVNVIIGMDGFLDKDKQELMEMIEDLDNYVRQMPD